jgi:hypothetical protein
MLYAAPARLRPPKCVGQSGSGGEGSSLAVVRDVRWMGEERGPRAKMAAEREEREQRERREKEREDGA